MIINRKGFTLVEVMIVVAIIGFIAAIAIPNFVHARDTAERNTCIANLSQIQKAVQIWGLDVGAGATETPTIANLVPNYIRSWPACRGVAYAVPEVATDPVCPNSLTDHSLPSSASGGTT
jgi:prepilin-type N-terminal cleavage/methylation domain-containing protein